MFMVCMSHTHYHNYQDCTRIPPNTSVPWWVGVAVGSNPPMVNFTIVLSLCCAYVNWLGGRPSEGVEAQPSDAPAEKRPRSAAPPTAGVEEVGPPPGVGDQTTKDCAPLATSESDLGSSSLEQGVCLFVQVCVFVCAYVCVLVCTYMCFWCACVYMCVFGVCLCFSVFVCVVRVCMCMGRVT